jgi:hypothetical protein
MKLIYFCLLFLYITSNTSVVYNSDRFISFISESEMYLYKEMNFKRYSFSSKSKPEDDNKPLDCTNYVIKDKEKSLALTCSGAEMAIPLIE